MLVVVTPSHPPLLPPLQVAQKLQLLTAGKVVEDETPEGQRSPSPDPVYGDNGVRINTREWRARDKLIKQRHELITQMIKVGSLLRYETGNETLPRSVAMGLETVVCLTPGGPPIISWYSRDPR